MSLIHAKCRDNFWRFKSLFVPQFPYIIQMILGICVNIAIQRFVD